MANIRKLKVGATTVTNIPSVWAVCIGTNVYYLDDATFESRRKALPSWGNVPSVTLPYYAADLAKNSHYLGSMRHDEIKFNMALSDKPAGTPKSFILNLENLGTGQTKFDGSSLFITVSKNTSTNKTEFGAVGNVKKGTVGYFSTNCAQTSYSENSGFAVTTAGARYGSNIILHINPYTKEGAIQDTPFIIQGVRADDTYMNIYIDFGLTLEEYIKYNRTEDTRLRVTCTNEGDTSEPAGFIQIRSAWYSED